MQAHPPSKPAWGFSKAGMKAIDQVVLLKMLEMASEAAIKTIDPLEKDVEFLMIVKVHGDDGEYSSHFCASDRFTKDEIKRTLEFALSRLASGVDLSKLFDGPPTQQ